MNILRIVDKFFPPKVVLAHCDVPCGIYDPHEAQMAAHTIIRMISMISDLEASSDNPPFEERKKIISQIARLTKVKEDHAELVKQQVRIIWGDYFKAEHLEKYKDLFPRDVELVNAAIGETENPLGKTFREVKKVIKYAEKGDLAREPLANF